MSARAGAVHSASALSFREIAKLTLDSTNNMYNLVHVTVLPDRELGASVRFDTDGTGRAAMSMERIEPNRDIAATARAALQILGLFSEENPVMGVTEIGQRLGMHKSKSSRLAAALRQEDFLTKTPCGRYRLGSRLYQLNVVVPHNQSLIATARSALHDIATETGSNAHLGILVGSEVVHMDRACVSHLQKRILTDAMNSPAHATSAGKVLMAYSEDAAVDRVLRSPLPKYTRSTVSDPADLRHQLREIRLAGYAVTHGEYRPGLSSVAMPILSRGGDFVAAISVVALTNNLTGKDLANALNVLRKSTARIGERTASRA